jgi:pimeloyl-ACP methyl ester carboxylesterase
LVVPVGLAWAFAVPREIKIIVKFLRWHDANVRASGYVERNPVGTRIYWEEFGKADGPPVVVLPAGLCTLAVMGGQIQQLAAASYRVIAIDARGNGKSSNAAPVLTYEMMGDDVIGVLDALKIEQANVVGWSDGGNVGLDLAQRYSGRVRKLWHSAPTTPPPLMARTPRWSSSFRKQGPTVRCSGRCAECTRRARRPPRSGRSRS